MRAALAFLVLAGCGSSPIEEWDTSASLLWRGADRDAEQALFDARVALEGGDWELADDQLQAVLAAQPENLTAMFLEQELALARPGADSAELAAAARARATRQGRAVVDVLLAARLETDREAARLRLEGALASEMPADLEAACRYALAYVRYQQGDNAGAFDEVTRAVALDPGALRARRLEARLVAGGKDAERGVALLEHWLDQAELAPEVSSDLWYGALVELAGVQLASGATGDCEDTLERLAEGRGAGRFRAPSDRRRAIQLLLRAAIDADDGEPELAIQRVLEARTLVPASSRLARLALIDKALLDELYLGRELDAIAAWEAVLARFEAATNVDSDELLRALEARVRLARLRAAQPE